MVSMPVCDLYVFQADTVVFQYRVEQCGIFCFSARCIDQDARRTSAENERISAPKIGLSRVLAQDAQDSWRELFNILQVWEICNLTFEIVVERADVECLVSLSVTPFVVVLAQFNGRDDDQMLVCCSE